MKISMHQTQPQKQTRVSQMAQRRSLQRRQTASATQERARIDRFTKFGNKGSRLRIGSLSPGASSAVLSRPSWLARQTRSLAGGASGPTLQCWPVGLMDKMSAPGAGNPRFESWAGHLMRLSNMACTGDRKVHREPQSARVRALAEQRAPDTTYVGSADASGIRHVPPPPPATRSGPGTPLGKWMGGAERDEEEESWPQL